MVSSTKPIARSQALRQGYTDKELRGPRFQRLFQGVYLPSGVRVTLLHRAMAALLVASPGAYVSHHTAAALWGGIVPDTEDTHISVPGEATRSIRRGIFAHRADPAVVPVDHRGVATSPPLATFLQLASLRLDLVALVVLGDSLVRRKRVTPERLVEAAAHWNGKGARLARRAAGLVRWGVDSAMETQVRLLIVLAGLPEPQVNFIVRGDDGAWQLRFDLCYPELKLIVEYDGLWHLGTRLSGTATSSAGSGWTPTAGGSSSSPPTTSSPIPPRPYAGSVMPSRSAAARAYRPARRPRGTVSS